MSTGSKVWAAAVVALAFSGTLQAAMVVSMQEQGYDIFRADSSDLINIGTSTYQSRTNTGGSNYSSDATGLGLNNGTVYSDGGRGNTEGGRTYCPQNNSSILFTLTSPQTIKEISSISGGDQARRSQKWKMEVRSGGAFSTLASETQANFVSNAVQGEMRVHIYDDAGLPLATNVDQIRVTYFNTGASLPESMYRELDILGTTVTSSIRIDDRLFGTADIRTASNNPFLFQQKDLAGANFYYAPGGNVGTGRVNGVGFDDINVATVVGPSYTQTFPLSANGAGPTLTLNLPFTSDHAARNQSLSATGPEPDQTNLETIANEMFYLSSGLNHPSARMTFNNLGIAPLTPLYVQVIGGDAGWSGDILIRANGNEIGTWAGVADGNGGTAALYAFNTEADANGNLDLLFTGMVHYSGISAIIISAEESADASIPEPGTLALLAMAGMGLRRYVRRRR